MKGFVLAIAMTVTLFASSAFAGGFGAVNVAVNGRGFNVLSNGASVTAVNSFVRRNTTVINNGLGTTVVHHRNGGLFPIFGRRNQTTVINNGAGFVPAGANVFAVNGRGFNTFNAAGFNAFGTATFTDGAGNVFEADAFGNTVFRGNAFNRGFGINGLSTVNSGVFLQSGGFVQSAGFVPVGGFVQSAGFVPAGGFSVRSFGCR